MRRLRPAFAPLLALCAGSALAAPGTQEIPVDLPPDIREDVQTFLKALEPALAPAEDADELAGGIEEISEVGELTTSQPAEETHAESAEPPVPPAPVPEEPHAEAAENAEPVPAVEVHAESAEGAEADSVATPAFDAIVALYALNNGLEPKLAREILAQEAKAKGLSCEAFALKVIDDAGFAFDESGDLVDKPVEEEAVPADEIGSPVDKPVDEEAVPADEIGFPVDKPVEGEAPAAVRGGEAAATEPMASDEVATMVPQTVRDIAAAHPPRPTDANAPSVEVLVAPNGFTWQGLEVEKEDLVERIRIFGKNTPGAHLRIRTFEEVPVETIRDVMAAAQDAGIGHVSVSIPSVSVPRIAP